MRDQLHDQPIDEQNLTTVDDVDENIDEDADKTIADTESEAGSMDENTDERAKEEKNEEKNEDVEEFHLQPSTPRPVSRWLIVGIVVILILIALFTIFGVSTLMKHPPLQEEDFTGGLALVSWLRI